MSTLARHRRDVVTAAGVTRYRLHPSPAGDRQWVTWLAVSASEAMDLVVPKAYSIVGGGRFDHHL